MSKPNDALATLKSTDRRRAALLLLTLAVGAALTWWTAQVTEERVRAEMLVEARIAAQAINMEHVLSLSGSEEDLRAPYYGRLKEQLARMRHASPHCRFLYLMGRRADRVVFLFVDSLPPDSEDYAPPGLVYEEVSDSYLQAFDARQEAVVGPVTDRRGTLVTALVPLTDPQTEELVAVLGMDVEASHWNREIIRQCLVPFVATLVLAILILAFAAQRQQVRARRESEERWRSLTETSPDHILTLDADLNIQFANFASPGLTVEELIGTPLHTYVEEERQAEIKAILEGVLRTGDDASYETIYHRPDGTVINYESCVTPRRLPGSDEIVGLTLSARDITARVRAEEALLSEKLLSEEYINSLPGLFYVFDEERFVRWNKEWERITGYSAEELATKYDTDFFEGEDRTLIGERMLKASREGAAEAEAELVTKDGRRIPYYFTGLRKKLNGKDHLVGLGIDITERKRMEQALRESEEHYRALFEHLPIPVFTKNREGEYTSCNAENQRYWAISPIGRTDAELLDHETAAALREADLRVMETGDALTLEEHLVNTPLGERQVLSRKVPLRDGSGNIVGILGASIDITERKQAEDALRRRNRELALLNQTGRAFVSTLDLDQVLVTILEEVCQLLDVTASSVWLVDPETDALVCQQASSPQRDIVRGWRLAPGEGIAGWVAHHGETLIVPDMRADERHFKGVDRQTGVELCSILSVPLRVKQHVIGVLQVADTEVGRFATSDLALLEPLAASAAIAIENARLYEQAQQDAETKSTLLREIDHRVKNNLTGIIGLLYAARNHARVEDQATYQSAMNDLISRVRGLATVHNMLSISSWAPLQLSDLASQVIHASLQVLPRDKRASIDVPPSPVRVTSDQAHYLALVINELATNTVKHALRERDTAHITFQIALDSDTVRASPTVRVEFRDDGPGLPEDVLRLEHHGVGFDLIQNVVRDNLRGEMSLHNDDGVVVTIQFKTGTRIREANDK